MSNAFFKIIINYSSGIFLIILTSGIWTSGLAQVPKVERTEPPMEQLPQEQNQLAVTYDDEIKQDEMPDAVTESVKENYSGFKIKEVFRGSDGSYKVKLEKEKENIAAFYDAGGEFIRIEKDFEEDTINDDWR